MDDNLRRLWRSPSRSATRGTCLPWPRILKRWMPSEVVHRALRRTTRWSPCGDCHAQSARGKRVTRLLCAAWAVCALCTAQSLTADVTVSGSGNLATEQVDLEGFNEIVAAISWQVEVARGDFNVQVTADDNILDDVRVEMRGNTLLFGLRAGTYQNLTLRARVTLPSLNGLQVSDSGRVTADGFETSVLQVDVAGVGRVDVDRCRIGALHGDVSGAGEITVSDCEIGFADISISGNGSMMIHNGAVACVVDSVSLSISGAGSADLRGCTFADAEVAIDGAGDGLLALGSGALSGSISGVGSVTYYGTPTRIDVRTTGLGEVLEGR